MARTAAKGEYTPMFPEKYFGKYPIIYRSSWEHSMMLVLDKNTSVIGWSSESVSIPYLNPLTGRWSMYIPDFLVAYADRTGKKHAEIIEVKPMKERPDYKRKQGERLSERTKLAQIVNAAKWQAAVAFCAKNQLSFRVASEDEMFAYKRKNK